VALDLKLEDPDRAIVLKGVAQAVDAPFDVLERLGAEGLGAVEFPTTGENAKGCGTEGEEVVDGDVGFHSLALRLAR
jgi:hypothetical protein